MSLNVSNVELKLTVQEFRLWYWVAADRQTRCSCWSVFTL